MTPIPTGRAPAGVRALAIAVLLIAGPAAAAEWEKISDEGGILVERRTEPGSSLHEVRATAQSPLAPAAIAETIWDHRSYPTFVPHLKRLDILADGANERVNYEQVAVPVASDRDYTVRVDRRVDQSAQRYEIRFVSANDAGPPPDTRYVRVTKIQGGWTVEPGPGGKGSIVRYQVLTDPGGSVPAWVSNRAQRESAAELVRAMLQRAQATHGGK